MDSMAARMVARLRESKSGPAKRAKLGNLPVDEFTLLAHWQSPLGVGGSVKHSQSPIIATDRAVMADKRSDLHFGSKSIQATPKIKIGH